jgi:hypothetical protein
MKNRRHAGQDLRHGNKIILLDKERQERRTQPIPTNVIIGGALVLALLFFTRK